MRTVIVGGVAGGMSAATRLRRLDEEHEVVVFERGPYVSYANCGLPYHVGGVIEDRKALMLNTPESLAARFSLDVRTGTDVVSIDRDRQVVVVEELATKTRYEVPWDHLVLSPGAAPFVPDVPGVERALHLAHGRGHGRHRGRGARRPGSHRSGGGRWLHRPGGGREPGPRRARRHRRRAGAPGPRPARPRTGRPCRRRARAPRREPGPRYRPGQGAPGRRRADRRAVDSR